MLTIVVTSSSAFHGRDYVEKHGLLLRHDEPGFVSFPSKA